MTTVITISRGADATTSLTVDGVVQPEGYPLTWTDQEGMPFTGIYVDGQRQFDVEIWIDGTCRHRVPPENAVTQRIYDAIEGEDLEPDSTELGFDDLAQVKSELHAHPGGRAHLRWKGLWRMLDVHQRNARELGGLLDGVAESPDIGVEMFQNTRPPEVREEVEAMVDQRLHNYVASAASLVDHSRRLLGKYEDSRFFDEYEVRRAQISESPVARFIKDLRNYALHRELPFVGNYVTFEDDARGSTGPRAEIRLTTKLLLEWENWSAPARQFLVDAGESITLRDALAKHVDLIRELYQWVWDQYEGLHRFELVLFDELVDEYNWVLSGGREGARRRFSVRHLDAPFGSG